MINPEIFKAYDIRGIYGQDFEAADAYKIGQAYAALRKKDTDITPNQKIKVAVGMDMRISSLALKEKLSEGLTASGFDVYDFGLVSTPAFYFAVSKYELDGGVMVSASHNPKEWNGFKIVRSKAAPVSGETGLDFMREAITNNKLIESDIKGEVIIIKNIAAEQLAHDLQYIEMRKIKQLKVVIDTANGMGA